VKPYTDERLTTDCDLLDDQGVYTFRAGVNASQKYREAATTRPVLQRNLSRNVDLGEHHLPRRVRTEATRNR
jgi:hypothetical protein